MRSGKLRMMVMDPEDFYVEDEPLEGSIRHAQ
jgi:hypothetical protein